MKYPQLVSTRAVNAISDWLVSRLEQLGVEAPLIYSRLLLSLLQSSVQINDPIEFNNLETFLANRKGNKRYPSCDTETLKKIAAVQCLMDTVSSEQDITIIESLVDELFEKLSVIEKQMTNEDDKELIENSELSKPSSSKEKISAIEGQLTDIEDPTKRYFTAFPALSKEMEDSVRIIKRNTKALTWPFYRNSSTDISIANSQAHTVHGNTAGVKRKTKRRRNQAMSKGKLSTSTHKNSYEGNSSPTWDTDFEGTWEMGRDLIKEFKQSSRNRSTSESAAYNLRKSGFEHENREKRMKPMANDESDEHNHEIENEMYALSEPMIITNTNSKSENLINVASIGGLYGFDITVCDDNTSISSDNHILQSIVLNPNALALNADEGYSTTHENLTSLSEIADGSLNLARRLYERDISNDSLNNNLSSTEQNDFAQFKAKFNSSVEALWKTDKSQNVNTELHTLQINPNNNNLDNFWTNYYNHHYNAENLNPTELSLNNNNNPSIAISNNNMMVNDSENEFFSMPNYLGNSTRISKDIKTPTGFFMHDSIWSENSNKSYSESDDSFYSKVISSFNYSEPKIIDENGAYTCYEEKSLYNPLKSSKWSEGINGVPSLENNSGNTPSTTSIDSDQFKWVKYEIIKLEPPPIETIIYENLYECDNCNQKMKQKVIPSSKITLPNHSVSSGFVEYSLIKPIVKQENMVANSKNDDNKSSDGDSEAIVYDDENLLTSERTHFHPIKSFADGHSFDISSQLDDINYERSQSGYLYFESDKYLEYNSSVDGFVSEDSISLFSSVSSTTSLSCNDHLDDLKVNMPAHNGFVIKFRLQNTDMSCQTDLSINNSSSDYIIEGHLRNINENNQGKFESIASQKEFVNISDCVNDVNYELTSKCVGNNLKLVTSVNITPWSMAEIGKKCVDNNNSTHTLWGMCTSCNNDFKSVPANRLLKEELDLEGDEIMSDLKYMRDLNIGSDWGDDEDDDTDLDAETIRDCEYYQSISSPDGCASGELDDMNGGDEQKDNFYSVTKLIADLLKPENAKSLADALKGAVGAVSKRGGNNQNVEMMEDNNNNNNNNRNNNNNNNSQNYVGGIWSNNEIGIWKNDFKPMDILAHLNNNESIDKLDWRYSNLAELWNNKSPPKQQLIACQSDSNWSVIGSKHYPNKKIINSKIVNDAQAEKVISKNFKNLLPSFIAMPDPSFDPSSLLNDKYKFNDIKRIQNYYLMNNKHAASYKILNRFDRKRRHSASQNFTCNNNNNNNNNDIGTSNNNTSFYLNRLKCDFVNKSEVKMQTNSDYILDNDTNSTSLNCNPKDAVITCKYWTTMDSTHANDSLTAAANSNAYPNANANPSTTPNPFFIDKNLSALAALNTSSILKHVTLVSTRPLTR